MGFRAWVAAVLLVSAGALGSESTTRPLIDRELHRAAAETGVPYPLLSAIAYLESHWMMIEPDHEHAPIYGVMGLRDDAWFGSSLTRASELVGLPPETLKTDVSANIRGGAYLLRALKDRSTATKSTAEFAEWKDAVLAYTGIPAADDRELYWDDLMRTLASGVSRNGIEIEPRAALKAWAPAKAAGGLKIDWDPSQNFTPGSIKQKYVVTHTTQGSFASAVSWLKNPEAKASAHYVIRASDGYIKNLVRETDRAWHARCWNPLAIGIEHEGFVEDQASYPAPQVLASSELVKRIVTTYSIPVDDMHIFGHDFWTTDRYKAHPPADLPNCNDHVDPGQYWDWTRYFGLLAQ